MKVIIKRFDKTIPLPQFKTSGAACIDLYAREEIIISPKKVGYIPLNIALQVPTGCFSILSARSSTHKMGLMPANGIGIIDSDYCGDNDELIFAAYNFTSSKIVVEKGTRIAQLMVLQQEQIQIEEVDALQNADRGGFGSTGTK